MSVHYKFKSALEYDTVTFDGLHISVRDLKNGIMQQKRIGKNTDFDLQVTNAQTKEVYDNEEALIPKNTSLLIARIPSTQSKQKTWEGYGGTSSPVPKVDDGGPIAKAMDLSSLDASEEDKIKAMMSQSTQDYDPSNYLKIRGANQMGAVPPNYRCFKCHQGGHWIKDCPLSQGAEPLEIKKSTGIPRSFMVPVEGPQVPGAMMTPNGSFAVPVLDHQAYNEKPQPAPPEEKQPEIPDDLVCSLCSDLLTDAVMIPCCGDSFCDECIRSCLLESEEHECPACHERDISPGTLIPNRYLRNSVANFKNTTGYVKRPVYKPAATPVKDQPQTNIETEKEPDRKPIEIDKEASPPPASKSDAGEKTIISEADSTEPPKSVPHDKVDFTEDIDLKDPPKNSTPAISEGPPGVSPKHEPSPKVHTITNVANAPRSVRSHKSSHERSPRRPHHVQQSPSYQEPIRNEDRPGTPTVDEPGGVTANSMDGPYSSGPHYGGPPPVLSTMMGMPPPNIQGPPLVMPNSYGPVGGQPLPSVYPPPNQGPPPNFRLPPPGAPPYIPPGYNAPPRPVFECARPPLSGPPSFPPIYSSGPRPSRGRDYSRDIPRRGRTPPRIIDDPLEAFNRMLREKDERERRAKQRKGRSYSRSSSRSFSRSPRRMRSRSPRRRSRSRSRSFTMSRSRSRSFSPSPRASPIRQYSPKRSPHRRGHSRFRSPIRSPLPRYRYKEQPVERERERGRDRDYERDRDRERDRDKEFRDRERDNRGYSRERDYRDRDRDRDFQYYDGYERERGRGRTQWNQSVARKEYPGPEAYYHPPDMASQAPPYVPPNRYPPRDMYLPPHHLPPVQHPPVLHPHPPQMLPPMRRYEDVAPPGTEQPPVPGLENTPRLEERYTYEPGDKFSPPRDKREEREKEDFMKHERHSRSPERRYPSPKKQSKERDYQATPEKKRRRREESPDRDKKEPDRDKHDRRRDASDDEKTKKNKDKKKKKERREKKEEEKKKRREKREKREQDKLKKEEREKVEKRHKEEKKESVEYEKKREASEEKETYKAPEIEEHKEENKSREVTPEKLLKEDVNDKQENVERVDDFAPLETKVETKEQKKVKDYKVREDEDTPKRKDSHKETKKEQTAADLYGDLLSEGIDNTVIQNYGKIKDLQDSVSKTEEVTPEKIKDSKYDEIIPSEPEQKPEISEEDEESEKDILELHTNEADLKADLDTKSEVLVPLPERSKWEVDEDVALTPNSKQDTKAERVEKAGKVTTEVLKRAENAIFAKAINAIRPIEIKKISLDRAKLYSGERDRDKKLDDPRNIHVTIHSSFDDDVVAVEPDASLSKPRLSVKERLGCKVDDLDRIVKVDKPYDRNRSRSLSPLSRRAGDLSRNLGLGERRIEVEERRRSNSKTRHSDKSRDRHRRYRPERESRRDSRTRKDDRDSKRDAHKDSRRDRERESKKDELKKDERKEKLRSRSRGRGTDKHDEDRKARDKKRSRSRTSSHGKNRRKDKKEKRKEKSKKHKKDDDEKEPSKSVKNDDESKESKEKPKVTTEKRKPTLDEASFEPDYDLETESEKEEAKKEERVKKRSRTKSPEIEVPKKRLKIETKSEDSSSSSSDSSSEDDRKRKKHRKHKKKKARKESSSSSSSDSESESSEDERDRKRKKHKKKQKKRKKSKHK